MPAIVNPNSPDQTTEGQLRALAAALKDLANNNIQAPYSLTVGPGGITDQGPTVLQGGNTVTGGETVDTLHVTGVETVSGAANLNGGANIAGLNVTGGSTVTGGENVDNLTASNNVTANGQVNSAGSPLKSQPTWSYVPTTSYRAMYCDGVTFEIGYVASTRASKTDLVPFPAEMVSRFLDLQPQLGRYVWDEPDSPLKVFLIAEDAAEVFGPDVVPPDEDGKPASINYAQLVVPLLATVRQQQQQIAELTARLDKLENK